MSSENLTRDEARSRASFLSTDSYEIRLDLTTDERTFLTETTLRFSSAEARPTFVDLIAESVQEIELNGELLADPASRFDGARVQLPALAEGENSLRILATGRYMNTGEGLHRFVDPVDDEVYLYTQFEVSDARRMFACFEQPDLKATYALNVTAPAHWRVISNAPTPAPTPAGEGTATWDFAPTERMSTYLVALIAGNYQGGTGEVTTRDGRTIPMGVFARASLAEHVDAQNVIDVTRAGIDFYEEAFDQDFPFRKYDQVFVPEYNMGAMENPGAITYVEAYVFRSDVSDAVRERRDLTILHELAHMWFGDLVTMRWWDDLWLNESFAEYASTLASAEATRWTDSWTTFALSEKGWAYQQDQLPSTHPVVADMVDLEAVETNFDGITYAKGASVLRQLVAYVGRDAFLAGVRDYFATHAFGNTQLSDLLSALEKSSGRDLSGWSAEWLEVAGVNTMRAEFDLDEQGRFTRFVVVQTAPEQYPTLRSHRMAIGVYALDGSTGSLSRRERVEVDITGERTEIAELVGVERGDLVLLNDDDLTYTKIRLDEQSLASVVEHIHHLDSPLSRALCWGAAWDMCRDGEMAAQDYVATVLRGVGTESDLTAVQALLGQATIAAELYTQPGTVRDEVRRTLEQGVARALVEAEAGSDHQLAIARALATAVTGETGAAVLQGWLDGEEVPAGLTVDTDLRWHLVANLARVGAADEATIDAEVERDNTIAGREAAGGARAAIPTRSAKAEAWRLLTEAEDMPNESYRRIAAQFFQTGQEELVGRYLEPYLDAARAISEGAGVWARRGVPLQKAFLTSAFPVVVADQALVTRVTEWLADDSLSDPVRRAVSERCDDAVRALRCQDTSARA